MEVTGIHRKSMYSSIQPDFFAKSLVLFNIMVLTIKESRQEKIIMSCKEVHIGTF